jgi:glycosyltransferase involved in cell wall biosynthesis
VSKIRIAHVIKNLPFHGGTTQYLHGLLAALDLDQFPSEIIVLEHDAAGDSYADVLRALGVPVTYLHMRHSTDTTALKQVAGLLRAHDVALVQTHLARSHIYGGLAALWRRCPVIITEHGIVRNRTLPVRVWDNLFGQQVACIVCNSAATQRTVQQDLPLVHARKVCVVYPGVPDCAEIDRPALTRSELGLQPDDLVVGYIGTFMPVRRHEFLLDAFAQVAAQVPRARLLLMGEGPLRGAVEASIQAHGLADAVRVLGAREDARQILGLLDAYVNPASAEAFGIATVEAMLASLPIVVTNSGALPELITHEHTGLVVESENVDALAAALDQVLTRRTAARQWGQAARQSALVRFSPAQFAHHFAAIYRSVHRG